MENWNTGFYTGFKFNMFCNLRRDLIRNPFKSVSSLYEGDNFKPCLTKKLLNMFKLWCERGFSSSGHFPHGSQLPY